MQRKNKKLLSEFVFPAAVSILLAVLFNWGAEEIIWGFWAASFWLGIAFCMFLAFLANPHIGTISARALIAPVVFLLVLVVVFHSYSGGLIESSGITLPGRNAGYSFYLPYVVYEASKIFFPFVALCVYEEIKNIFFTGLYTGQQFIRFFVVFARLQLIALACFYLRKYIPDVLLYLLVYSIAFFPVRMFEPEE